jgi:hypothetical protein
MSVQPNIADLKEQFEHLFPGKWLAPGQQRSKILLTGLPHVDHSPIRGIFRQRISEWVGSASSGKTTTLRSIVASWCASGLHVAYIDTQCRLSPGDWSFTSAGLAGTRPSAIPALNVSAPVHGRFWVVRIDDAAMDAAASTPDGASRRNTSLKESRSQRRDDQPQGHGGHSQAQGSLPQRREAHSQAQGSLPQRREAHLQTQGNYSPTVVSQRAAGESPNVAAGLRQSGSRSGSTSKCNHGGCTSAHCDYPDPNWLRNPYDKRERTAGANTYRQNEGRTASLSQASARGSKEQEIYPRKNSANKTFEKRNAALWAADQLLRSDLFDVVILDLGGLDSVQRSQKADRMAARLQRSLGHSKAGLLILRDSDTAESGWGCHTRLNFQWGGKVHCDYGPAGVTRILPSVKCEVWKDGISQSTELILESHVPNRLFTHPSVPDRRTPKT